MPLHPEVEQLVAQLRQFPPITEFLPHEARQLAALSYQRNSGLISPDIQVQDSLLPNDSVSIPLRFYTPSGKGTFPILVYFHGGGWVLGSLDAVDGICRQLCIEAQCIVVSVDYRLAPEHKFPAAVEDAYAATLWVSENAVSFNGNPDKIAIAGDSAGGNLAAVVALIGRDKETLNLLHQLLIYPVTNYDFNSPSYTQYAQGYGLRRDEMIWFWQHYLTHPTEGTHLHASPLQAKDFTNLPSATIITAEFDVLQFEGEAYAQKLQQAGVQVNYKCYEGMIHAFIALPQLPTLGKEALEEVATQLKAIFY